MTTAKKIQSHAIIHAAAVAAGGVGAGLAQIPCADSIPLSGIQITMIVSLGGIFGTKITRSAANAVVLAFAASYAGRSATQLAAGWIPGFGNAMNATTAAALTEAMGWYVALQFDKEKSVDEIIKETTTPKEAAVPTETTTPTPTIIRPLYLRDNSKKPKEPKFEIHAPIFNDEDLEDRIIPDEDLDKETKPVDKEVQDGMLL